MKNLIKRIEAKIAEMQKGIKSAQEVKNNDLAKMYSNQQTGLYIALNIALEEQGKEISGE